MNILVVNDDGYTSIGIGILADAFRKIGNVYVVAPHTHQSGASSSITVGKGLIVHKHKDNFYSVEGTPSDCVKYAIYGLNIDFDLVVSGVNNGFNIGIDTVYSGTIGACMEALFHEKKAIAFSTDANYFDIVKREIDDVIKYILSRDLPSYDFMLNVNFAKKEYNKSNGIIITDLAIRGYHVEYSKNEQVMVPSRTFRPYKAIEGTDLWAHKHGFISITPLKIGNGDKSLVHLLKEKVNN